ncbi:lysozyme inhibitor LprI family protein [Gilvimarinus sp. DA14]|uniref:lysozyme inhibitor LprI family protein n=1 Tax=Gilvimarinus sp. DA14 TaxID=2956798 RepID=UPI0020B8D547|nr:lysozyme inhibitor LprI family protein [Gilvimarinus sp. DA14]UTF58588.1 hypothetical protein NHM04_08845 [Gilvimarinus sp. DA14]
MTLPALAMHPSWDVNGDGVNDCENNGSCDHTIDYTKPRPVSDPPSPSFSCAGERLSSAEQAICETPDLARLDLALHDSFQTLLRRLDDDAFTSHLRAVQRGWIKGRDECWKSPPINECVASEYAERLDALQQTAVQIEQARHVTAVCEQVPDLALTLRFYSSQPAVATVLWRENASLMYRESTSPPLYRGADTELRAQGDEFIISGVEADTPLHCWPIEALEK